MVTKVGFIGLHRDLQLTLVENILKGEFPLTVYDPSEEPLGKAARMGAQAASSPKEVAEQADIISVSLRDEPDTEEALLGPDGVLAGAQPGSVIVIHTTVEPEFAVRIGDIAKQQNVGVLDVAYSGGVEMARTSTMLYAVGGREGAPRPLSSGVRHVGVDHRARRAARLRHGGADRGPRGRCTEPARGG